MDSPDPSPRMTSSPPLYGAWSDKLDRSEVIWCEAPVSTSHVDESPDIIAALARGCHDGWKGDGCQDWFCWDDAHGGAEAEPRTIRNWGQNLALWPCVPHAWHRPRYGLGERLLLLKLLEWFELFLLLFVRQVVLFWLCVRERVSTAFAVMGTTGTAGDSVQRIMASRLRRRSCNSV